MVYTGSFVCLECLMIAKSNLCRIHVTVIEGSVKDKKKSQVLLWTSQTWVIELAVTMNNKALKV